MNVWEKHRKAYEASIKAQEGVYAADLALEDARREIIQHVSEVVGSEDGFADRLVTVPDSDPLLDFVKAAESRYAETLGMYKPRKPLQIEIMNPRSLDTGEPKGVGEAPFDTGSVI
jgi:hypothetical protein